jgi:CheY-like chemotaxis protein
MIDHAVPRTRRAPAANANANENGNANASADAGDGREVGPVARAGACRQFHRAIAPAVTPAPDAATEMLPPGGTGGPPGSAGGRLTQVSTASSPGIGSPETAAAPASTAGKRATILIADDERRIRLAIRGCLEAEGYTIYEACDGTEALNQVLLHAPDLLILDLAMPNLDGMRTLRELHALHGQLKPRVVMLTAFGSMPAAASAIGLGAAAFAEKPLVPEALRQLVARVLAEPPDADDHLGIPITWPADSQ